MSQIDELPPLRDVIARYGLSAKKQLGQNFRTVRDVCWSPARRAEDSQQEGADAQAISPMPELLAYWFSPQDGLEMSRRMAEEECGRAHQVLAPFGERAARLHELADLIVHRKS